MANDKHLVVCKETFDGFHSKRREIAFHLDKDLTTDEAVKLLVEGFDVKKLNKNLE